MFFLHLFLFFPQLAFVQSVRAENGINSTQIDINSITFVYQRFVFENELTIQLINNFHFEGELVFQLV